MDAQRPLPDEIRALEQTRNRLNNVSHDLGVLLNEVVTGDPLPPWPKIHQSTQQLSRHVDMVLNNLRQNSKFLSSAHVYPTSAFPGQTQENLLHQLIRKKLEVDAEEFIDQGEKAAQPLIVRPDPKAGLDDAALMELWDWAPAAANGIIREVFLGGDEEDEGEEEEEEDDEEEDEDEGDAMQGVESGKAGAPSSAPEMKMTKLDHLLRFMITGVKNWTDEPARPTRTVGQLREATGVLTSSRS